MRLFLFTLVLCSCDAKPQYEQQRASHPNPRFKLEFEQTTQHEDFRIYLDTKTGNRYLCTKYINAGGIVLMPKEMPAP